MNPAEEPNEPDRRCVSYRCRLCRFPIQTGETVVAGLDGGLLTPSFPFSRAEHHEEGLRMVLRGCYLTCPHEEDDHLPAYHVECVRYAPPLSKEGLYATNHTFEPTTSEDPRRASRTRDVSARRLHMAYPNLPVEVCLLITENLVRECAAIATHEILQGRSLQAQLIELDTSLGVWARYVSIDGIRYVESLSNTGDSQSVLLVDADGPLAPELLYVLEDHLGIRQVIFATHDHAVKISAFLNKPMTDAWWETLPVTGNGFIIRSDGLKLRTIISKPTRSFQDLTSVAWPKPLAPFQEPMFAIWAKILISKPIMDMSRNFLRTMSLQCNDPAVTGYSVCWINGIRGIHAHYGMEKIAAYDDLDQCNETPTWVHIPLHPGERVTGIWARRGDNSLESGVMFETDRRRLIRVGYCENSDGERLDSMKYWAELSSVTRSRFRVDYQLSYRGAEKIVAHPLGGLEPTFSGRVMPACPSRHYPSYPECHYSSVGLENVVEIIPCRRKVSPLNTPYWAITGLLFRYANGNRACAGEFRMDCAGDPMNADGAMFLYLGSAEKADTAYWHLSMVSTRLVDDDECLGWWCISAEGTLQWWFGADGRCKISWIDGLGEVHEAHGPLGWP